MMLCHHIATVSHPLIESVKVVINDVQAICIRNFLQTLKVYAYPNNKNSTILTQKIIQKSVYLHKQMLQGPINGNLLEPCWINKVDAEVLRNLNQKGNFVVLECRQ